MERMSVFPPGRQAPEFEAFDQHRRPRRLQEFRGDQVLLFFYAGDQDEEAPAAAAALRARESDLSRHGVRLVGVNGDDIERNRVFTERHEIRFPILADVDKKIMRDYGVIGDSGAARRVSFLIAPDGMVERVYEVEEPRTHPDQVLQDLAFFEHVGRPA